MAQVGIDVQIHPPGRLLPSLFIDALRFDDHDILALDLIESEACMDPSTETLPPVPDFVAPSGLGIEKLAVGRQNRDRLERTRRVEVDLVALGQHVDETRSISVNVL